MELEQIRNSIKMNLSESRYRHVLGVEEVCLDLALIHEGDTFKAGIAGLLHDCAKHLTEEELIRECKKYNLPITEAEMRARMLYNQHFTMTDDPGLKKMISFLGQREDVHKYLFEKAQTMLLQGAGPQEFRRLITEYRMSFPTN